MAINVVVQSFRYRRMCCGFNVPHNNFMDKQIRLLNHCMVEMDDMPNHSGGYATAKLSFLSSDHRTGAVSYRPFIVENLDTGLCTIFDRVVIWKPPQEYVDQYENAAAKFKAEIAANSSRVLEEKGEELSKWEKTPKSETSKDRHPPNSGFERPPEVYL